MATTTWHNWTGDERCAPAVIQRPASTTEVAHCIERAAGAHRVVRVAGSGHSMHDAVATSGTLLHLDRMDRLLEVDHTTARIRVQAGITLHQLNLSLVGHGLALENLGDIDKQTVAGAIATATHGTGSRLRNLSAQVLALEMVLADGTTLNVDSSSDAETLLASRVALGSLGVVTTVTLQCVPAFTLRGEDRAEPLEGVLDQLAELNIENDHFEFFAFPVTGTALTMRRNRVDQAPRPRAAAVAWLEDVAINNGALSLVCRAGRRAPRSIPALNRLVTRLAGSHTRVDRSFSIFAAPRLVHFTEMEYAIPAEHAAAAVRGVMELVEGRRLAVNFPIEVRFAAADDAMLSTTFGRTSAFVAVHTYAGMAWRPYFRAVEAVMDEFGGRPHWGKRHFQDAGSLRGRYPQWDRFQAVRARLDPGGRFTNDHVARVLGPPRVATPAQPQRKARPSPR